MLHSKGTTISDGPPDFFYASVKLLGEFYLSNEKLELITEKKVLVLLDYYAECKSDIKTVGQSLSSRHCAMSCIGSAHAGGHTSFGASSMLLPCIF